MEHGGPVGDAELLRKINVYSAMLHNKLVVANPERYQRSTTFTGDGSTRQFALPGQYMGFVDLGYRTSTYHYAPVPPIRGSEHLHYSRDTAGAAPGDYDETYIGCPFGYRLIDDSEAGYIEILPTPQSGAIFELWYTYTPKVYTLDTETVDGVGGWEDYITLGAAIECLEKEESFAHADRLTARFDKFDRKLDKLIKVRNVINQGGVSDVGWFGRGIHGRTRRR